MVSNSQNGILTTMSVCSPRLVPPKLPGAPFALLLLALILPTCAPPVSTGEEWQQNQPQGTYYDQRQGLAVPVPSAEQPPPDPSLLPGEPERPPVVNPVPVEPPLDPLPEQPEPQPEEEAPVVDNPDCFSLPLTDYRITFGFLAQYSGEMATSLGQYHPGEDLGVPKGTPLFAIADGTVLEATRMLLVGGGYSSYGNVIYLEHQLSNGTKVWSLHAHLDAYEVNKGEKVSRGQRIGRTGCSGALTSGCSFAEHLHFEVRTQYQTAGAWTKGWDAAKIRQYYVAPSTFIAEHSCD